MCWKNAGRSSAARPWILIALAVATTASVSGAQAAYKLTIFTSGGGYLGTAQVTSTPAGIDCRSESSGYVLNAGTCSAEFPAGSTVTVTATPRYGGTLDGWADDRVEACAGQAATCQIVMTSALTTSPKTIAKTYTLTILGTGNSSGQVGSADFWARPKLNCIIGPGGVTSGICATEIPANQIAWLSRDDGTLYAGFAGFTGCDPNSDCMLLMDRPRTVTAGWNAMEIIIGPAPGWNGSGKVTGAAFDCAVTPTGATGVCSAKWENQIPPMSITLTATPTGNSVFRGWQPGCTGAGSGGNVCVVPLQIKPIQIRPVFEVPIYGLYVLAAGSGNGKVVSAPPGINCTVASGATNQLCAGPFANGTEVTLTADPTDGSTFGGWSGGCTGSQSTCVVNVSATTTATVRFNAPRPAAELALALLAATPLSAAEEQELDRFGNKDGTFNLGDLLALLARTGERLPATTMSALMRAQRDTAMQHGGGRNP